MSELGKDWVECLLVREIHLKQEDACPLDAETISPFGAQLGRVFQKWANFGSRYVHVPAPKLNDFNNHFREGGWHVQIP